MILLFLEFIISIKVDSSWFPLFKPRSVCVLQDKWLAMYRRVPLAFDLVGMNSKE